MRRILLFLIFISSHLYSDNVYLTNGYVYKNVIVLDTLGNNMTIIFGRLTQVIPLNEVRSVIKLPLIPNSNPVYMEEPFVKPNVDKIELVGIVDNTKLLPVAFLAAFMAWNSFETASQAQNAIDANDQLARILKIKIDNSALEEARSRNQIIGIGSALLGCMTLAICFNDELIVVTENKLTMRVTF